MSLLVRRSPFSSFSALTLSLSLGVAGCATGGSTTTSSSQGGDSNSGGSGSTSSANDGGSTASTTTTSSASSASASASSTSTSTSTSSGDGGNGGAGGAGGATTSTTDTTTTGTGGAPATAILGDPCAADAECVSGLCKAVLLDTGDKVCVSPCTTNAECTAHGTTYFCDPITPGATDGYCVPRSPAHCLSCDSDAQCGTLSETCFQADGDKGKACHVDCTIGGEDACPSEYSCVDAIVAGAARKVCRPNLASCEDALGGFCDRVALPQSCSRDNAAGVCLGQRTCQSGNKRYTDCDAPAPQCLATCQDQEPAGCTLEYCPSAVDDPLNCGSCGNVCPGNGTTGAVVSCSASGNCDFKCDDTHYDVDGSTSNGCEAQDGGVHTQSGTTKLFDHNCDSDNKLDGKGLSGAIASDEREHSPAIASFDASAGAAPDWFKIRATGGALCGNDIAVTFTVTGSSSPSGCYKATLITNEKTYTCTTNGSGTCSMSAGNASYAGGTDMFFKAEKICSTATVTEKVSYKFTGHL